MRANRVTAGGARFELDLATPEERSQPMHRIREATDQDRAQIREVYLRAFPPGERQTVAALAVDLLRATTSPATFALVAELDGRVAGHVAFSPVTLDDSETCKGYLLAPLAVMPGCQHRGIGSELVETGTARLRRLEVDLLFVYGDPEFYRRFGFRADDASNYLPPYRLLYPTGWQALMLQEVAARDATHSVSCVAALNDTALW